MPEHLAASSDTPDTSHTEENRESPGNHDATHTAEGNSGIRVVGEPTLITPEVPVISSEVSSERPAPISIEPTPPETPAPSQVEQTHKRPGSAVQPGVRESVWDEPETTPRTRPTTPTHPPAPTASPRGIEVAEDRPRARPVVPATAASPVGHETSVSQSLQPGEHKQSPTAVVAPVTPDEDISHPGQAQRGQEEHSHIDPLVPGLPSPATIENLVVESTTFGSRPWWTSLRWTQLPQLGWQANDVRSAYGVGTGIAAMACSVRGRRHRLKAEPNEDAFALGLISVDDTCEFLVAVVCDGMGSAKYSSYGSQRVAELTAAEIKMSIEQKGIRDLDRLHEHLKVRAHDVLETITSHALSSRANGLTLFPDSEPPAHSEPGELQTTLSFAVIQNLHNSDTPAEAFETLVGVIGDSPILMLGAQGPSPLDSTEESGTVFSSSTYGALGATDWDLARITITPDAPLMLSTDGIANYLTHAGTATGLGHYINQRWLRPLPVLDFIRDVSFDLPSADDDRTALMVWPHPSE